MNPKCQSVKALGKAGFLSSHTTVYFIRLHNNRDIYASWLEQIKDHGTIIIEPIDHFVKLKICQLQLFADSSNLEAVNIIRYTVREILTLG